MMKLTSCCPRTASLVAAFFLVSCGSNNPALLDKVVVATPASAVALASCALPVYDVKELPLATSQKLDSTAIATFYIQSPMFEKEFKEYNRYENIFQFAATVCNGFTVVPFYREDESGHHELYYVTLKAKTRQLESWALIAAWGSDGGWNGTCTLRRTDTALRVTTVNHLTEEDIDEKHNSRLTKDSVVTDFRLHSTGQLKATVVGSKQQTRLY